MLAGDCSFGLQIFSDVSSNDALHFWQKKLGISPKQFYKVTVTPSGSLGTYRHKNLYGVLTIYYNNTKLKKKLDELLAAVASADAKAMADRQE